MKTINGWEYFCRVCWKTHLIPYSVLSEDPKQKISVYIACPEKTTPHYKISPVYNRENFKKWVGDESTYNQKVVEPFCIESK